MRERSAGASGCEEQSMNIRTCIIICLCFLLQPAGAFGADSVLRVGVHMAYPPFAMADANGHMTGFDVEMTYALCKEMGRHCVVQPVQFSEMIPALVAGELDMAVGGMAATPERLAHVDFTDKYFRSLSIYVEKKAASSGRRSGLTPGMRVGVQKGTIQERHLYSTYGVLVSVVSAATFGEVFALLSDDVVDIILVGGLPGYMYLKSEKGRGFEQAGPAVDFGTEGSWASIAVSRTRPGLCAAVNAALTALRRNGEYGKINRKYFDFPID